MVIADLSCRTPAARGGGAEPATRHAFLFPGQGSQEVGMGADLLGHSPRLRGLITRAEELTGRDLAGPMLTGPQARLNDTVAAQLAIFALSLSLAELLTARGIHPAVVAGHSLGEYAALVSAGWLDIDDALGAVAERALAMAACCAAHDGAMAAILGLAPETIEQLCRDDPGIVVLANRNGPNQSVISGEPGSVGRVADAAIAHGALRAIGLPVTGAFHSPLMLEAEQRLAPVIARLRLRAGGPALVSSITGEVVDDVEDYRRALAGQITGPVIWDRATTTIRERGVDVFVEVGAGHTLAGLLRRVDRRIVSRSCDGLASCLALACRGAA
jgi:[acyl-carrier-protein] S-malonyltransferase